MSALFIRDKNGNFERVPAYSGGGGASIWEDLGSTFEKVNVLEECSPIFSEDEGMFVLINPIEVIADQEYTVNWNGAEYRTKAVWVETDGGPMIVLGDAGMVTTGEPTTGEPFAIATVPADMVEEAGYGAGIFPLDGSVEVTLSIVGNIETVTLIPMKYIPKMSYCIDVTEEDMVSGSNGHNIFLRGYDTTELYNVIINFGQIWLQVAETTTGENIFYRRVQLTMIENPIPCKWEDMEATLEANGITEVDISSLSMELTGYDPFEGKFYRININMNT